MHGEEDVKNDLVKSIDELKKVLEKEPSNVEGHYYLGLTYYDKGMVSEAVGEFSKTMELDKNYINAYFYLGAIHTNQGDIDKAILKIDYLKSKQPPCEDFEKFYKMEFAPLTATYEIGTNREGKADFYYHDVFIGLTATHMYIVFGGTKKHDEILSIVFPYPYNKELPNSWWAIWSGLSRERIPIASKFFISQKEISIAVVRAIFDNEGITIGNSIITYESNYRNDNVIKMNDEEE